MDFETSIETHTNTVLDLLDKTESFRAKVFNKLANVVQKETDNTFVVFSFFSSYIEEILTTTFLNLLENLKENDNYLSIKDMQFLKDTFLITTEEILEDAIDQFINEK